MGTVAGVTGAGVTGAGVTGAGVTGAGETGAQVLADFLSGDATRIWQASGAVLASHDRALLAALAPERQRIAVATRGVELGGMLRPNRTHLDFALRKLDFVATQDGCLCALYPAYDLFDPMREAERGHVECRTLSVEAGTARYQARCPACGQAFSVREEGGYHYAWFVWEPVAA